MLRAAAFSRGAPRGDQLVLIDFGGVKQVSTSMLRFPNRSTRLFSSGYSPPEQLLGGNVGPQADFYALGRTMIELVTGKNPADLEDSMTGELRWRHLVNIKPKLGDLLDEMVKSDSRSRPASATNIQKRLAQISQASAAISVFSQVQHNVQQTISKITQQVSQAQPSPIGNFFRQSQEVLKRVATTLTQATSNTIIFTARTFISIIFACLSTIWAMVLTGFGACMGTIIGFLLASQTNWGNQLSAFVSNQLPGVLPNTTNTSGAGIILFAIAGLGTAWGLTTTGVFGQKRRYIIASVTSVIGYVLGWVVLQAIAPKNIPEALIGLILIAVSFLTLGIGLRSHHIVHSVITAFGTAITFALLIGLNLFPADIINAQVVSIGTELTLKVIFFSSIGILLSFYLAVSHYLIVPWLRLLGWN
jgi:Protein kinase domain